MLISAGKELMRLHAIPKVPGSALLALISGEIRAYIAYNQ